MKIIGRLVTVFFTLLLLVLVVAPRSNVYAATIKTGDNIFISKSHTINDNLFASGSNITIDGDIKGDVYCAGENIQINGKVDGDVICIGRTIVINGSVNGNVRAGAESITILGPVGRNAMVLARDVNAKSNIHQEMFLLAETLNMQGLISQNLNGNVGAANITGSVGNNVNLDVDTLKIGPAAKIAGDLNYRSENKAEIATKSGIIGNTVYEPVSKKSDDGEAARAKQVAGKIFSILSTLVVALLLVSFWPKSIEKITEQIKNSPLGSFGFGILAMFLIPVVAILLMFTLIGLPVGILLFIMWGVALFTSRIFVAILVGRKLLESYWKSKKDSMAWATIVGIVIVWIVFATPFIGGFLSFVAMLIGLGAIFYSLKPARKNA